MQKIYWTMLGELKDLLELTGPNGGPIETQTNVSVDSLPLYVRQLLVLVSNGEGIGEELERVLTAELNERFGRFLASARRPEASQR